MEFLSRVSNGRMLHSAATTAAQVAAPSQGQPQYHRGGSVGYYTLVPYVIMLVIALLCVLMCVVGCMSSLIRYGLRWSRRAGFESHEGQGGIRHGGVTKREVKSLPIIFYSDGIKATPGSTAGAECAICLKDFVGGDVLRVLPACEHGFHIACVDPWLVSRSSCPTCRRDPIKGPAGAIIGNNTT